ncbi:MAG: Uncharacterized protein FD159_2432 [Syntrophaceae bacterium]|nr:MAG: Uncharacterized protein FD159_2432 [Syntrophaceae bacterium]
MEIGNRVKFLAGNERKLGTITSKKGRLLRVKGDDGKLYINTKKAGTKGAFVKNIKMQNFGIMVFDTRLDSGFRSKRQTAHFFEEYAYHAHWGFAAERIHNIESLKYFMEKRQIPGEIIIFSGHGHEKAGFSFCDGPMLNEETVIAPRKDNYGKILIFSSCLLGSNANLCMGLLEKFKAKALITYKTEMFDQYCFLAETFLLQILAHNEPPKHAVDLVNKALKPMKNYVQKSIKTFPMVCFPD